MKPIRLLRILSLLPLLALPARASESAALLTIPITEWYALGPLGHPDIAGRGGTADWPIPTSNSEIRNYNWVFALFHAAGGDPLVANAADDNIIDLDTVVSGPATMNVNGETGSVRWAAVTLTDKAPAYPPGQAMAKGMGVVQFSTWIHVPENTAATVAFDGYGTIADSATRASSDVYVSINRYALRTYRVNPDNPPVKHPVDHQTVYLRQGWNHVFCRHISAWGGVQQSMKITVPAAVGEALRISRDPPPECGRRFLADGSPLTPP